MLSRAGQPLFEQVNPWGQLEQIQVLPLGQNEFFFANLESPLGDATLSADEMNLCADPSQVSLLEGGHLSLVNLSNNHRDDCAPGGEAETKAVLTENGLLTAGSDLEPAFLETPQGRLTVIAADVITGTLDVEALLESVRLAKGQAGLVIVSMHWGNEYQGGPDERQQHLAQQLADAGVDVIWGHHPHVLQRMQWLKAADGRQVLVLYSLGNLLSDQWMLEDAQRSALVKLTIQNGVLIGIEIIPIEMDRESRQLQWITDVETREVISERLNLAEVSQNGIEIRVR